MNSPDHEQTPTPGADPDQSVDARRAAASTLEELLVCATEFDRTTIPSADAEEWFRAESQSLLQWALNTGRILSKAEFSGLIEGFKILDGGLEHQVFLKKRMGRVFKRTKPPHFGHTYYLKDYVRNVIWCNLVFGDDMRLEGVIQTEEGVSLIISQPAILGRAPTELEIEEWFAMQGCVRLGNSKWIYPSGLVVSDAHTGNFILTKEGALVPIDLHVEKMGAWQPSEDLF